MENKSFYIKPEVEIVDLELEGLIASSPSYTVDESDTYDGPAYSKPRNFWGKEE